MPAAGDCTGRRRGCRACLCCRLSERGERRARGVARLGYLRAGCELGRARRHRRLQKK